MGIKRDMDSSTNTVTALSPNTLHFANAVDGDGFDGTSGAAADLAVNGVESFDLIFSQNQKTVGFAIHTGSSNYNAYYDHNGASFEIIALDANAIVIGTAIHTLEAGGIDHDWLSITSLDPFRTLQIREIGNVNLVASDQYFGNVYSSATVPEPSTVGLLLFGISGLWFKRFRAKLG